MILSSLPPHFKPFKFDGLAPKASRPLGIIFGLIFIIAGGLCFTAPPLFGLRNTGITLALAFVLIGIIAAAGGVMLCIKSIIGYRRNK